MHELVDQFEPQETIESTSFSDENIDNQNRVFYQQFRGLSWAEEWFSHGDLTRELFFNLLSVHTSVKNSQQLEFAVECDFYYAVCEPIWTQLQLHNPPLKWIDLTLL